MTMETAQKTKHAPARKSWVYGILVVLVLGVVAYFGLMNRQDRSTNHDYYRVLYEASNTFNENLNKLNSMHEFKESAASIRSLLPSYSRTLFTDDQKDLKDNVDETNSKTEEDGTNSQTEEDGTNSQTEKDGTNSQTEEDGTNSQTEEDGTNSRTEEGKSDFAYLLDGKELKFVSKYFSASLLIEDILPTPKKGFSQYLFADHEGNVLSTVGGERTISIVDLSSINQEIQRKNKQFQLNLADTKQAQSSGIKASLPSYSNHVDMKISYGEFRVYVFPFTLTKPIHSPTNKPNEHVSLNQLYLVGLLPQHELAARDSGHWNVSLLVVTIISLLFMWSMLRLYLLPKNQSITKTYRVIANVSSYLFYIVIIALVLAYFQKTLMQNSKDQAVVAYAQDLNEDITSDLFGIFTSLNSYRYFYQTLLTTLETAKQDTLVKDINEAVVKGLANISIGGCDKVPTNLPDLHKQVGSAATSKKRYPPEDYCKNRTEQDKNFSFELDSEAINILINAYKTNKADVGTLDFFSQLQKVELRPNKSIETYIDRSPNVSFKNKILSVFALNGDGKLVLPSIYYQESHSLPATYNLSHRNYYKQVRDHKGWDLELPDEEKPSFKNVYIQRLLNINNGTRGTTISMPLFDPDKDQSKLIGRDHIIGADVLLPSLSLRETPPFDFTYMIVERRSGKILFHNDTARSMVENLYFSGDTGNKISQKVKAGLDQDTDKDNSVFHGMYHGEKGRFALSPTVVDEWAIVMFYPDDTLQALMTNQFLFISISFAFTIALMMLVIYAVRTFIWTSALKEKLRLPAKLNIRFVMLVSSVMLSASYSLYLLGTNIDLLYQVDHFSIWLPFAGILIATVLVYKGSAKLFSFPPEVSIRMTRLKSRRGAIWIISAVLIVTFMHFYYIQKTSVAQSKSLENYYQQIHCHWLNYERAELISTGLSRYTNSITTNRIDPLLLLPLEEEWYDTLRKPNSNCDNRLAASSLPDDFPRMSTLTGSISVWQWVNTYLWRTEPIESKEQSINGANIQDFPIAATLLQAFLLITIILVWFKFNIRVLWYRLYCPERFMQHITRMTESVRSLETGIQNRQLRIECDTVKLNGVGMNLLLSSMSLNTYNKSETPKRVLLEGFTELFEMSPCLQSFSQNKNFLPNLKLNLDSDPTTGLLNVHIWDIDTCLEKGVFRQLLLDLIMEFKSLTLANQLHSFTISAGFHSLQRVKMKDPLSQDNSSVLDNVEYLSWSECLMDFVVVVPDSFKRGVDWELLEKEVEAFPDLKFLVEPYDKPEQKGNWSEVLKRDEELYQESNWATINYLLLNADALYRFKWESCSSAEKLALINLAKQNRINPMNTQMIEHLALNGLITVRKGHLDIVNRSFAHFVLNAETRATLNQLVSDGEAGVWKNYKLPIGIMILLIIGGIALTSGESIYIIAASVAGVLGTVVSVTNSANMLRGGSK